MAAQLLQFKVDSELKAELQSVAEYKGIPVTSLVKMFLKDALRHEKRQLLSENGLTFDEELTVLQREAEFINDYKKKNIKTKTGKAILKELHA